MQQQSFDLAWTDRGLGAMQSPRRFLDYLIGGRSFYELHGQDRISVLGWFVPEEDERAAERLVTGSSDLDGRTAIAVCPEDGDLVCGAISTKIVISGEEVRWTELALSSYDYLEGAWTHDALVLPDMSELRFDSTQYRSVIGSRPKASFRGRHG
jgi:hypothetical protein